MKGSVRRPTWDEGRCAAFNHFIPRRGFLRPAPDTLIGFGFSSRPISARNMSAIRIIAFPECQLRGAGQCVSSIKTFADVAQVECSKWRALTQWVMRPVSWRFYAFSAALQTAFWFTR